MCCVTNRRHIPYLQLFKQPDDYRCRVVSVKGTVKLAYRVAAEPNYLGVNEYVVYVIHPAAGPGSPIIVYALAAPAGFPAIANRDRDGKTTKLDEDVELTGVFFKRWAYQGQDGTYTCRRRSPATSSGVRDRRLRLALARRSS